MHLICHILLTSLMKLIHIEMDCLNQMRVVLNCYKILFFKEPGAFILDSSLRDMNNINRLQGTY